MLNFSPISYLLILLFAVQEPDIYHFGCERREDLLLHKVVPVDGSEEAV